MNDEVVALCLAGPSSLVGVVAEGVFVAELFGEDGPLVGAGGEVVALLTMLA